MHHLCYFLLVRTESLLIGYKWPYSRKGDYTGHEHQEVEITGAISDAACRGQHHFFLPCSTGHTGHMHSSVWEGII